MHGLMTMRVLAGMALMAGVFLPPPVAADDAGEAGTAVVEGVITFKGEPPAPKLYDLSKFLHTSFCAYADVDQKGRRVIQQVHVTDGHLQDVVVSIQGITMGQPFAFGGTDVKISRCQFLVQGGPSSLVGVVVNGADIRIVNEDADPSDPQTAEGLLHHAHAYEVLGDTSRTLFDLTLAQKGQVIKTPVALKQQGSVMKLEGEQLMQAYFHPVDNPYYAIVEPEGTYEIDQVPPGKYRLRAWHPILGARVKEIEVGATGHVTVNFEFSK